MSVFVEFEGVADEILKKLAHLGSVRPQSGKRRHLHLPLDSSIRVSKSTNTSLRTSFKSTAAKGWALVVTRVRARRSLIRICMRLAALCIRST